MRKLSASHKWRSEILWPCQQGVLRDVQRTRREGDQKLPGDGRKSHELPSGGMRSMNTTKVLSQPTQPARETGGIPKTIPKPKSYGLALQPAKPHAKQGWQPVLRVPQHVEMEALEAVQGWQVLVAQDTTKGSTEAASLSAEVRQAAGRRGTLRCPSSCSSFISPGTWVRKETQERRRKKEKLQERRPPLCVSRRGVGDRISQKCKFLCSYILNTCSSPRKVSRSDEGRRVPVTGYSTVKTSAKWLKIKGRPV